MLLRRFFLPPAGERGSILAPVPTVEAPNASCLVAVAPMLPAVPGRGMREGRRDAMTLLEEVELFWGTAEADAVLGPRLGLADDEGRVLVTRRPAGGFGGEMTGLALF
jgi:hypothetical protein